MTITLVEALVNIKQYQRLCPPEERTQEERESILLLRRYRRVLALLYTKGYAEDYYRASNEEVGLRAAARCGQPYPSTPLLLELDEAIRDDGYTAFLESLPPAPPPHVPGHQWYDHPAISECDDTVDDVAA